MQRLFALLVSLVFLAPALGDVFRGRLFVPLGPLTTGADKRLVVEPKPPSFDWDELVVSWNFRGATNDSVTIEAQVRYPDHESKWYVLGQWAHTPGEHPRQSIKGQRDGDGTVDTDTLKMKRAGGAVRLRITTSEPNERVDFLGFSFCDSKAALAPLPANTNAWGKILTVEERTQADYPEGINEWCSPTSTSMLLAFWSDRLNRPELRYTVPDTARAVHDPSWPGTGNWPFNMAFAGWHMGLRAYVARLSDVSEMEDWIEAGLPLAFSVSYSLLQGKTERGNGHLLVCIGFTESGDIVVNDPGRRQVRQIYKRENLIKAWAESENTVYLIYPEGAALPRDRFHHWTTK